LLKKTATETATSVEHGDTRWHNRVLK